MMLSHDEIFTYLAASQPTIDGVLEFLLRGAESQTLGYHLLARASLHLPFFRDEVRLRIPSILAGVIALVYLFRYFRRFHNWRQGIIAGLLLPGMVINFHLRDARGYALVFAVVAATLYYWRVSLSSRLAPSVIRLAICSFLLSFFHYSAGIYLIPFLIIELVIFIRGDRSRWPIALSFAASLLPLVLSLPILKALSALGENFYALPTFHRSIVAFYETFGESIVPFFLVFSCSIVFPSMRSERPTKEFSLDMLCVVLLAGIYFVSLPAFYVVNAYNTRYVIAGCIGLVCLAAHTLRGLSNRALMMTMILVGLYAIKPVYWNTRNVSFAPQVAELRDRIRHQGNIGIGPIVFGELGPALPYLHYLEPSMQPIVLVDPDQALRITGNNTGDIGAKSLIPNFPEKIIPLSDFLARNKTFSVFTTQEHPRWLIPYLQEQGYRVDYLGALMPGEIFQVSGKE